MTYILNKIDGYSTFYGWRLMLAERLDAATAAFQVGYESPSQFSRENGPLFGDPPLRDITKLRKMAVAE